MSGDGGGRGGKNPTDRGSPPPPRSLEEDAGMIKRGGRPLPAAQSNHTREDYGRAQ